jgi:hypothetical protein
MPSTLIAFVLIFLLGAILRSSTLLTKFDAERLAFLVFSVSLPATILVSLDRAEFAPSAWKLPLAACLVTLPMVLGSWQLARLLRFPRPTQGGFLLATGSINSVYFAFPVVLATLGTEGLAHAVLFDLGQTTLTLTVLYGLAIRHGAQPADPRSPLRRLFSAPPLWALAVTLVLKLAGLRLPAWLHDGLLPLHLTTTPLASLVLGLSINLSSFRRTVRAAVLGVGIRMGGGLALGFAATWLLTLTGMERAVVILVAGMPSAVTAVILAAETGLDEELVASIVALSLCVGMALLPWLPSLAALLAP